MNMAKIEYNQEKGAYELLVCTDGENWDLVTMHFSGRSNFIEEIRKCIAYGFDFAY